MDNKIEIESQKQIRKGAIMSYLTVAFYILTGVVYTPWMIKQIGQSEYGLYSLAITIIGFFAMDFGLGEAVSRFLSRYLAEKDEEKAAVFLGTTFKLYLLIDIFVLIVFIGIYIFADVIYAKLTAEELVKFKTVFLISAIYSVTSFVFLPLNGVLISYERFAFKKFTDLFQKIITVVSIVTVILLGYRLYALVIVNALTGVIIVILKVVYSVKNKLIRVNFRSKDTTMLKEIFGFSLWTAVIAIAQKFITYITPTVLAAVSGSIQVSIFSIALSIDGYVWAFALALNGLFLPKVTRLIVNKDSSEDIEALMIRVGRIQLSLAGLLILGLVVMGKEFMLLWMGMDYIDSYYVVVLLVLPYIITLTQEIANTALMAKNQVKYRALSFVMVAVISLLLSIILSKFYGAIGSGIAIFIGTVIGHIICMNIVYHKVLHINVFRFFKECHLKMLLPLLITAIVGVLIQVFLPTGSTIVFMAKVIFVSVIYFILLWKLALNSYEKRTIGEILGLFSRLMGKLKKSS